MLSFLTTSYETQGRGSGILEQRIQQFILEVLYQHALRISLPQGRRKMAGNLFYGKHRFAHLSIFFTPNASRY